MEKYGKIVYGGTPIIMFFFSILYWRETKKVDFIIISSFSWTIALTIAMYYIRYIKKVPLKNKNEFYYYLLLTICWAYVVLKLSPFEMCTSFLFETVIGFFVFATIGGFFFIALLFLHIVETWNELTGENIWEKHGLT